MSGIADAIAASKSASNRRFQHAMQAEQKRYFERGLEDIRSELVPQIGEVQEQAATLTEELEQVQMLTDVRLAGMEAKDIEHDTLIEGLRTDLDRSGPQLDEFRFDIDVMKNVVGRLVTAMDKVAQVPGILRDPESTAGGLIDGSVRRGHPKAGVQIATGMITLMHQSPVPGWLPCDGRDYQVAEYPELAAVLNNEHGASANGAAYFKVPDITSTVTGAIWMVRY